MKWRFIGGPPDRGINSRWLGHSFLIGIGGRGDGEDGYKGQGLGSGGNGNTGNGWDGHPENARYEHFVRVQEDS